MIPKGPRYPRWFTNLLQRPSPRWWELNGARTALKVPFDHDMLGGTCLSVRDGRSPAVALHVASPLVLVARPSGRGR
jgi:hypothetical protein